MSELKIHSYPKHIADWRSGTARMSLAQEGAYGRLCDQYYLEGGLDCTFEECLRICGALSEDERAAVAYVLDKKFVKTNVGYVHEGMDKRIAGIREASAKAQERSAKALAARYGKDTTSSAASIPAISHKPVEEGSRISNEILSPSDESEREAGFQKFLATYPQPDAKHASRDAWNAAVDGGASPESILAGLSAARAAWTKSGRKHIVNAKTWLEGEGWKDHDGVSHTASAQQWTGPPGLRDAVVDECGEIFALKWLDQCTMGENTLTARTAMAVEKLRTVGCLTSFNIIHRRVAA